MRKEIEIKVPYFQKGKDLEKKVKVSFISNRVLRDYNSIMTRLNVSMSYYKQLDDLNKKIADIIADKRIKLLNKRSKAKPFVDEITTVKEKIKESNENQLLEDRFMLIKRILEDNECMDDDLLSYDFWDNQTEAITSWGFLTQACMKDTPTDANGKKKSMNLTNLF